MRILFVTATYLPTINGVSFQTSILKKGLEKLGHKVFVLAPSFPGYKDSDKTVFRYPSIPNPLSKTYPVGLPLITPGNLKKINPDIVHTHHPSLIGQLAGILSDTLSVPLIFTAHTHYEKYIHQYFPHGKNITSSILNADLKNLSRKCYRVVCPSTNTERRLKKIGIKNTVVISSSIESNFFHKPGRKDYKIPTVVYTGRLEREKNPLFLVSIAKELKKSLPNFRLLILGDGTLFEDLVSKVHKEKLESNIILAGEVARDLLPNIYKTCNLFITPSVTEVMPLSIIEAMAAGIPALALKNSQLEDIVIDEETGFLLPRDPKVIAKKITFLFKNPKRLLTISKNAYRHSLNFTRRKKSKELEKLYKEAIVSTSDNSGRHKFRDRRERTL